MPNRVMHRLTACSRYMPGKVLGEPGLARMARLSRNGAFPAVQTPSEGSRKDLDQEGPPLIERASFPVL